MKKILTVSLVAMMAVSAARAEIASKAYVDTKDGDLTTLNTSVKTNLVAAINSLKGEVNTNTGAIETLNDDEENPNSVAGKIAAALDAVNADSAIQGVKVNNSELTPDANGKVDVTVEEGTTNGTIAVNGSDVAVHGLGSAAYTASTAYDAAGDAAAVQTALEALIGDVPENSTVMDEIADAGSDIKSVKVNGTALEPDANGAVNVTAAEGSTNGTIAVNGSDVAVHGLGSAAYTATTAYDAAGTAAGLVGDTSGWATAYGSGVDTVSEAIAAVATTANGAVQDVSEGSTNGTVSVDGTDVAVHGLGSAAYTASTAYDAAGTAAGLLDDLTLADTAESGKVVTGVAQNDGQLSATMADPLSVTRYTVGADGKYALTAVVSGGSITGYEWELISRTGSETAGTAPSNY